ncbi:MAG TPA: lactonase family protein [Limnochordia bacterium]
MEALGQSEAYWVYIGTYAPEGRDSLYIFHFDVREGRLTSHGSIDAGANPSFLALDQGGRYLYAVNEAGEGAVSAFEVDPSSGGLRFLNREPSGGAAPCHLSVDAARAQLLVANYSGGTVSVLPIEPDGRLGAPAAVIEHRGRSVHPRRQTQPHPHAIVIGPGGRFAFVPDLGLDAIAAYRIESGGLAPLEPPTAAVHPGAGPRHIAFHPSGRWAYVINELDSTVTHFDYDADTGSLRLVESVTTLPAGFAGVNHPAEIASHPSGGYLYASNRGHDSLAIYRIDSGTGRLSACGHAPTGGRTPRHFALDPTGRWLLAENQESDLIVPLRIDAAKGALVPSAPAVSVPRPVCAVWRPVARSGSPA